MLVAVVLLLGFLVVLYSRQNESWFVQAARGGAVRCLTSTSCVFLAPDGGIARPRVAPLGASGACAKAAAWSQVEHNPGHHPRIILACTEGRTYLYHMGTIGRSDAGSEQWTNCSGASCDSALLLFDR